MSRVFGFHKLKLNSSADETELEKVVSKAYLLKGDRGTRKGEYAFLLEFESVEHRNRYFPQPDQFSEKLPHFLESRKFIFEKFDALASHAAATDYFVD